MKIAVTLIIWVRFAGFLTAQNLVPNPSFEAIKKQPCEFLVYKFSDSTAQNIGDYLQSWYAPTGGTTDPWFHNDTLNIGPPPSYQCTQNLKRLGVTAHTGKRCIGIASSVTPVGISNSTSYREYIQAKLVKPMRQGAVYAVEFYVRRNLEGGASSNNLGAYFTTNSIAIKESSFRSYGKLLTGKPQINQQRVVTSTNEWTHIRSCFQADSAYQYITLGNFFDDKQTQFIIDPNAGNQRGLSYYFIDDVYVTEVGTVYLPPPVSLGRDTILCPNTSYRINLPNSPNLQYRWQDEDTSSSYVVSQSGSYWVEANIGGCVTKDTVKVLFENPPVLPSDTTICFEEVFYLKPKGIIGQLLWNDGSSQDSLKIQQSGTYWVRSATSVCLLADTTHIQVFDCPGEVPNVFTPNGDGKNDSFFINNIDVLPWSLQIYNRWGKKIYHSNAYQNDWQGEDSPSGLYYYYLSNHRLKRSIKGWVQILR